MLRSFFQNSLSFTKNAGSCRFHIQHCLFSKKIDFSKVPVLSEEEIEEDFVKGSGPGGQAVNKTSNCVVLKHIPSGIVVKCHESRSLDRNRKLARERLVAKLDEIVNGYMSVSAQKDKILEYKSRKRDAKKRKTLEMKLAFKEREGLK